MRSISFILFILLIATCFSSCKKDDDEETIDVVHDNIEFNRVIKAENGNFVLTGSSHSNISKKDFMIAAFDESYEKLWSYSLHMPNHQYGNSLVETEDGFVAVGAAESEYGDSAQLMVMKVSAGGDYQWVKQFMDNYTIGGDIALNAEGDLIITGGTMQGTHIFALHLTGNGDSIKSKTYPGFEHYAGNNILVIGNQYYMSTNLNVLMLSENLSIVGLLPEDFQCTNTRLLQLSDNAMVFYGHTSSASSLVNLYQDDMLVWSREYEDQMILSMAWYGNNKLFAVGKTEDSYFDKLTISGINADGELSFTNTFSSDENDIRYDRIARQVFRINDNTFLVWENFNGNKLNIYTVDENGYPK